MQTCPLDGNLHSYFINASVTKLNVPPFAASFVRSDFDEQNLETRSCEQQTSLPLKKRRKLSSFESTDKVKTYVQSLFEDISYPATPMMSIAEVKLLQSIQQQQEGNVCGAFKTPAQLKYIPEPNVQFNNYHYTINNQENIQINSQVPFFNSNQYINDPTDLNSVQYGNEYFME